jgi:ParB-like chromosome segregation protein Spo0J
MSKLAQHPLSALFPPMPPDEFRELVEDIRRQGVLEPIELLDGMVLDGWHRYLACEEAGVEIPVREWRNPDGGDAAFAHVWARNALRRHLTAPQRIEVAAKVHPEVWEKVGTEGGGDRRSESNRTPSVLKPRSAERFGSIAGVHPDDVLRAKRLERDAPDLWERAKSGDIPLRTANTERIQRQRQETVDAQREHYEQKDMEWKSRFVAELLDKIDATKEIPVEVRQGLKFNRFAPEAKPFVIRRLERAIDWLIEAQEELKKS